MNLKLNRLLSYTYLCVEPAGFSSLLGHHSLHLVSVLGLSIALLIFFSDIFHRYSSSLQVLLICICFFPCGKFLHIWHLSCQDRQHPSRTSPIPGWTFQWCQISTNTEIPLPASPSSDCLRLGLFILRLFQCLIFGQQRERATEGAGEEWKADSGRAQLQHLVEQTAPVWFDGSPC